MNTPVRRTLIGISALGAVSLVRATEAPHMPEAVPTTSVAMQDQTHMSRTAEYGASITSEVIKIVTGEADTASAATACDPRDTTPNPTYCVRATPTPTPKPVTPKPSTPTPTKSVTPTKSTAPSGGSTGGSSSGGSSGSTTCSDTDIASNPLTLGADCARANGTSGNLFGSGGIFQTAANTLIFLVGAVSIVFLIIGGMRYVISQGDNKAVTSAKNTILYAVIGIVVAVISFALVNFVINALSKAS